MRDLELYRAKRDPERTPEPFGAAARARGLPPDAPRTFVVQQHAARNMHWDLRLEIDGVLVSWAVPRGPSLDPAERRLAVQTEDHPLEYADFEGVIPAGNYGAGAMIVWDCGVYRSVDGKSPREGLEAGKLDLLVHGQKLLGRFALVHTARGKGREWLLLRKGDTPEEAGEIVERMPGSALSGLTVDELREGASRDAVLARALRGVAKRDVPEGELRPMLAARADAAFRRDGWLFEPKHDGVRALIVRRGDCLRVLSRTGGDRTAIYPEIALAARHLPLSSFVVDGEIVASDAAGRSSFERIQRRFTQSDPDRIERLRREVPVSMFAFDLLEALGRDVRALPLERRKQLLARFVPERGLVRTTEHVASEGVALFEAVSELGLEGIVAKRADSVYESGRRSRHWLKTKVPRSASLVIVGSVAGRASRRGLGSLMVAWHDAEGLVYAGNVGSGLGDLELAHLSAALDARRRDGAAFSRAPALAEGSFFVDPELVCEVRFTEVTTSGLLRHPVFLGLRDDIAPAECVSPRVESLPEAESPVPDGRQDAPRLTRLDKVFWPVDGYTKGDLLAYYEAVWPWIGPYLRDRPLVLTRYPDGIDGKSFFQRNAPDFTPDWVTRESLDGTDFFICNDLDTLLYVVNSGAIPLHVWSARTGSLDHPDWAILDLDPKEAPFAHVVTIARTLHRLLDELGVAHFAKTSGQDGLHVLLPLGGQLDHAQARQLAEVLARALVAELPEIATVTRPIAARGQRVYVDALQNGRGKLIAAPLSVRPRRHAPVSAPLTWRQVGARLDPTRFTLRTMPRRLERSGDPFAGVLGDPVDVPALLEALLARVTAAHEGGEA